jgi:hypothetical protein
MLDIALSQAYQFWREFVANHPDVPLIVSWGGGVNSTAVIVGLYQRRIRPNLILFADTGGEKPETYSFLDTLCDWLAGRSWPTITVVRKDSIYESLEDNCLQKAMLPSLAYGYRSCSDKWKRQPQDKFANHWPPAKKCWARGGKVRKALGYDAGEQRRARIADDRQYSYWYPLIEWGWYREDCMQAIKNAALPLPAKSACFFCPAAKKTEVINLSKSHPDLFSRAIHMEHKASGNLTVVRGLGRHWSWEELVKNQNDPVFQNLSETVATPCHCLDDGEDD